MNTRNILLTLVLLAAACSAQVETGADPIAAGLARAAEAGKPVLVLYTKVGCACSAMMDETLKDPEVAEALGNVVFVRVTKDQDAQAFESRWADAEAPSFVVLTADGEARSEPQKGPFEAGEFLFFLDWVASGEGDQPELVRIEDGCGGCGEKEGEEAAADAEGGCGGCGEEAGEAGVTDEAEETDQADEATEGGETEKSGCDGCSEKIATIE